MTKAEKFNKVCEAFDTSHTTLLLSEYIILARQVAGAGKVVIVYTASSFSASWDDGSSVAKSVWYVSTGMDTGGS